MGNGSVSNPVILYQRVMFMSHLQVSRCNGQHRDNLQEQLRLDMSSRRGLEGRLETREVVLAWKLGGGLNEGELCVCADDRIESSETVI